MGKFAMGDTQKMWTTVCAGRVQQAFLNQKHGAFNYKKYNY
jgi:hypothetical protein